MCICFFYINNQDKSKPKFVLFFNREEVISRPTLYLGPFDEDQNIIAGRDLVDKGTWLGINKQTLKLGFLTNRSVQTLSQKHQIQLQEIKNRQSRGKLIYNYLSGVNGPQEYQNQIFNQLNQYGACNLICGNLQNNEFFFSSFYDESDVQQLGEGFHSICNLSKYPDLLKKQKKGLEIFEKIIKQDYKNNDLIQQLNEQLNDDTKYGDQVEYERQSIFINQFNLNHYGLYGTKSTTILVFSHDNQLSLKEVTYDSQKNVQDIIL